MQGDNYQNKPKELGPHHQQSDGQSYHNTALP